MIYKEFLIRGILSLTMLCPVPVLALEIPQDTLDNHEAPLLQQSHSDDSFSESELTYENQDSDLYNSDYDWLLTEDYSEFNNQGGADSPAPWILADMKNEVYDLLEGIYNSDLVITDTKAKLKALNFEKYDRWNLLNMMVHVKPERFKILSTLLSTLPSNLYGQDVAYIALMTAIITDPAAHCLERCEFLQTVFDYAGVKKIEVAHAIEGFDFLRFLKRCEIAKVYNGFNFVKREHFQVKELSNIMLLIQSYAKISMAKYSLVSKVLLPFRGDYRVYETICRDISQLPCDHFDTILNKFANEGIGNELVPDFAKIIQTLLEINEDDRLFVFKIVCATYPSDLWVWELKQYKMPYDIH